VSRSGSVSTLAISSLWVMKKRCRSSSQRT
jgi:hypothetical protein